MAGDVTAALQQVAHAGRELARFAEDPPRGSPLLERGGEAGDVGEAIVGSGGGGPGGDRAQAVEVVAGGEELAEHDAEGVDVGAGVDGPAGELLGGRVAGRARAGADVAGDGGHGGDPEVGQLHHAVARDEDVGRGDVAVDQAERAIVAVARGVGVGERGADRLDDEQGGRDPEGVAATLQVASELGQRDAVDVLHHQVGRVVVDADVEELHDVAVSEALHDLGLGEQQRRDVGPAGELAAELLDHEALAKALGTLDVGQIHFAEPAAPEPFADDVSAQTPGLAHRLMIRHRDSFTRLARAGLASVAVMAGPRPADAAPGGEVTVWPLAPDTPIEGADEAVQAAGLRPRAFASLRARLEQEDEAARAAVRAALAKVEQALAAARASYLAQQPDEMLVALARAEAEAIAALPPGPLCSATLWEVEFQTGLAYATRKGPGDAERAAARFALAWALDAERRPLSGLYGPDVGLAFVQAIDVAARRPARPVRVEVSPRDARVVVDCRPLAVEAGLRPGLHAIRVDAPGHEASARVVEAEAIVAALPETPGGLGPWWVAGALVPTSASARAAVQRFVATNEVVWVEAVDGQFVARRVVDGLPRRVARAESAAAAVRQALAAAEPTTRGAEPRTRAVDKPRRRAGLWAGLAGAAVGAVALGLGLGLGLREPPEARLQLVVR